MKQYENFPDVKSNYLRAEDFQDNPMAVTFVGWEKIGNEDDPVDSKKKQKLSWKQKLKFCLRYSYPQYATDEAGEQILDDNGEPFVNAYWDARFQKGYTIKYIFDEGSLETGSLPLFKGFCRIKPKIGDHLIIVRTGKDKETKWSVKRKLEETPDLNRPDEETPF